VTAVPRARSPRRGEQQLTVRDGRARERLGADHSAGFRFDQRLEEDIDLFVRDRAFEHQVTPWGGG